MQNRPLRGQVAVVTGASRGVGRGIAEELGRAGATVYVTGRSAAGAGRTEDLPGTINSTAIAVSQAGGEGIAVECDHFDDAQTAALFERVRAEAGRLDLLVNNVWAGYEGHDETFGAPFWEQPMERWEKMVASLRAHVVSTREALPLLRESNGLVVTISASHPDGPELYRGNLFYDLVKTASDRFAFALASELEDVTAITLHPPFTRTERVLAAFDADEDADIADEETSSPRFTGRAVVALASDGAVSERTGTVVAAAELAAEYGFTDPDPLE